MYKFVRWFLFKLNPECAHRLTILFLRVAPKFLFSQKVPKKPVNLWGLTFQNPVGVAAGFDKNGECVDGLFALGFGFVEVGTVTPKPQSGNPRPRLFRIPEAESLINRMGFNNGGLDYLIHNIQKRKSKGILAINIGKNASTPMENALEDYLLCLETVYPYADIIVVNISSPNTQGLRDLQQAGQIENLLEKCREKRDLLAKNFKISRPLLLKITVDLSKEQQTYIAECLKKFNWEGLIVSNTLVDHSALKGLPFAEEKGGLSGRPLLPKVREAIVHLRTILPQNVGIVGVGGVFSAKDAQSLLADGANLVQLYTGMVYKGPGLIKHIIEKV